MEPVLSLIVATLDRPAELQRCLSSLPQEHRDLFEVIVVDQSPGRSAQPIVQAFENLLGITYVHQSLAAASPARNLGVAHARGEWVGFPDDDARFTESTLQEVLKRIASPDWDVITGMTVDETGKPSVLQWRAAETGISRRSLRSTVAESTLFLKREFFLACNGFDPIFGPGGSFAAEEAVDLIRRIQNRWPECRMRFFPQIQLIHPNVSPYSDEAALKKSRRYARARGASFARHWRQASKRRIASEILRHLMGSIVLRGLRRRSRIASLLGYMEGFLGYWKLLRHSAEPSQWPCEPRSRE